MVNLILIVQVLSERLVDVFDRGLTSKAVGSALLILTYAVAIGLLVLALR